MDQNKELRARSVAVGQGSTVQESPSLASTVAAMSGKSIQLKEEGNRHFQAGDFAGAEGLYSKA